MNYKNLNLNSQQVIEMFQFECKIEDKAVITRDDFLEVMRLLPGLTTELCVVLEMPIYDAVVVVRKAGLPKVFLMEMIELYETRIHREPTGYKLVRRYNKG